MKLLLSGIHASCSTPPQGRMGDSNLVPSSTFLRLVTCMPSKSPTQGCGISSTHSFQCLYIKSSMMRASLLGMSG